MDPLERQNFNVIQGASETPSLPPALPVELAMGTVIADGRYRIIATIGRGAMGCVYEVEQIYMKKRLAMKVLLAGQASDYDLKRFQKEAQAASRLEHPNLVHAVDFGMLEGAQPYLVMDLVTGITMANFIKENGPMPVDLVIDIFIPVCLALDYAHHEGIVHRDLKPSNIILERTGRQPLFIPKIVDFGIAKVNLHEETALTQIGEMLGTPLYMSPEQCAGEPVDFKSDIYSLGCVIFECLTGTPPFSGKNSMVTMMMHRHDEHPSMKEASMGLDFPRPLEIIMSKLLAKNPQDRYSSCMAIAQDFEYLKRGETQKVEPAKQKSFRSVASKKISKLTFIISAVVASALLVTAGVLVMLFKTPGLPERASDAGMLPRSGSIASGVSVTSPTSPTSVTSTTSVTSPTSLTSLTSPTSTASTTSAGVKASEDVDGYHFADVIEGSYCRMVSRQRLYEFPKSDTIGTLYWWTKDASKPGEHLALGTFKTPGDAKPLFDIGWNTLDHKATYLTGFTDDFLYGAFVNIRASWLAWGNDDALADTLKLLENQSKSLRILELESRHDDFSFSKAQLISLNKLTLVQWLVVRNHPVLAKQIVKFDFFPRLKVLALRQMSDCGLVFDKLRTNKNIERLSVFDCKLTDKDLQSIRHLRTLRMLELRKIEVLGHGRISRTDSLKYVAELPELEQLCIDGWNVIDPIDLKELAKMKKLKVLTISDSKTIAPSLVPGMLASIRSKLPQCKIEIIENPTKGPSIQDWCDPIKTNPGAVISWEHI
jgi:serine/threonine protein kinase